MHISQPDTPTIIVLANPDAILYVPWKQHGQVYVSRSTRQYEPGKRLGVLRNQLCTTINSNDRSVECATKSPWNLAARGCVH